MRIRTVKQPSFPHDLAIETNFFLVPFLAFSFFAWQQRRVKIEVGHHCMRCVLSLAPVGFHEPDFGVS
jgi:hypothetical protein